MAESLFEREITGSAKQTSVQPQASSRLSSTALMELGPIVQAFQRALTDGEIADINKVAGGDMVRKYFCRHRFLNKHLPDRADNRTCGH